MLRAGEACPPLEGLSAVNLAGKENRRVLGSENWTVKSCLLRESVIKNDYERIKTEIARNGANDI